MLIYFLSQNRVDDRYEVLEDFWIWDFCCHSPDMEGCVSGETDTVLFHNYFKDLHCPWRKAQYEIPFKDCCSFPL